MTTADPDETTIRWRRPPWSGRTSSTWWTCWTCLTFVGAFLAACAPTTTEPVDVAPSGRPTPQLVTLYSVTCRVEDPADAPADPAGDASTTPTDRSSTVTLACPGGTVVTLTVEEGAASDDPATYRDEATGVAWAPVAATIDGATIDDATTCTRAPSPVRLGDVTLAWTCGPRSGLAADPAWDGRRFSGTLTSFSITSAGFRATGRTDVVPVRLVFDQVRTPR